MRYLIVALIMGSLLWGCESEADFRNDIQLICGIDVPAEVQEAQDPATRATAFAKHVESRLQTKRGKDFFESFAHMDDRNRREVLVRTAESVGIEECPFLD